MDRYVEANMIFSLFCKNYMEQKNSLPVRPSEMGVLNIITQRDGKFTPLMIAQLLQVSRPMITAHITSLEKKGYITREYLKEDKRSFYIIPTDKGNALVKETIKDMTGRLQRIEEKLGEEKFRTLLELLTETNTFIKKTEE